MAIIEKMHKIQSELPRLAKDGDFDGGAVQYKFLAVDDVVKAVRPLMNKHGVVMTPQVCESRIEVLRGEASGARPPKEKIHLFLTVDYTFHDAEDGSNYSIRVVGEAADGGDKGVRKAMTSAQKIALIQAFSIETGEPDEHELSDPGADDVQAPEPAAVQQAKRKAAPAKKSAPAKKPAPAKPTTGMSGKRAEVKAQVIDAGLATGAEVNEVLSAYNKEHGLDKSTDASYQAVLDKFVGA